MPGTHRPVAVCVEAGKTKVFASALDWPGWCRGARTEQAAIDALGEYAARYAGVPSAAGIAFPTTTPTFTVVERLAGGTGTDFGVPETIAAAEYAPTTAAVAKRLAALVTAAWSVFDEVVVTTPPTLRKGPRGGGRDRDPMIAHVLAAEVAYARKIGIARKAPALDDGTEIEALREDIAAVLATPSDGAAVVAKGWPVRYAARRIAWHVLDHAWEMRDKSQ
jgi:hypothetical protein